MSHWLVGQGDDISVRIRHARLGSHLLHAVKLHMTVCFSPICCPGRLNLETGTLALELRNSLSLSSAGTNPELKWV